MIHCLRVGLVVLEGELVPEYPESLLLVPGCAAVLGRVVDASRVAFLKGLPDFLGAGVRTVGDFRERPAEGVFVAVVVPGSPGGDLDHLLGVVGLSGGCPLNAPCQVSAAVTAMAA